jgi:hypothetical protein
LLRAFQDDEVLGRVVAEADVRGYRTHEFGDSLFITNRRRVRSRQQVRLAAGIHV